MKIKLGRENPAYLVGTGKSQSVQHWNENMSRNEEAHDISAANEPILSSIGVDFSRDAYDGHGRLEGGDERQRHRQTAHAPVCHQELLRRPLPPASERVIQSDGHGSGQQDAEYHIVHNFEVLLQGRIHPEGRREPAAQLVRRTGSIFVHIQSEETAVLESRNTDYVGHCA